MTVPQQKNASLLRKSDDFEQLDIQVGQIEAISWHFECPDPVVWLGSSRARQDF